ncbi:MAG: hypothetical protein GXO43_04190 [Crenarchaeota archaeon]|nr:hypothetical protein [Thermoproteota archaeon]
MNIESIDQYIVCRDNCPPRFIEALAMNGFVKEARVEPCEKPRHQRIVVTLINGTRITSECRFDEEIKQSMKIIGVYIELAKKNKAEEQIEVLSKPAID